MSNNNKKVIICGAGISGLTTAHLLIEQNFNVEIYEKDSIAGGMARSTRLPTSLIPSEHSWRGYGSFYKNLFEIMKDIKIKNDTPMYTIDEIQKHTTENDLWAYMDENVYNLTNWVKLHPGGKSTILKVGGKDINQVWEEEGYTFHKTNSTVMNNLQKYKIGKIKYNDDFNNSESAYDRLNDYILDFELITEDENYSGIRWYDYFYLTYWYLKFATSDDRFDFYKKKKLTDFLSGYVSKSSEKYIVDFLAGPGYGFDKNSLSLGHYGFFITQQILNDTDKKSWKVTDRPTNECWIDPWVEQLKSKGVKFHFNHKLMAIRHKSDIIKELVFEIFDDNNYPYDIVIKDFDECVLCLNPNLMENIFNVSKMPDLAKVHRNIETINNQISFRLGFSKKLSYSKDKLAFSFIDSPYGIILYPQEEHWDDGIYLGKNIKSLWSGTCVYPYNDGSKSGEPASSLPLNELKEEILFQLQEGDILEDEYIDGKKFSLSIKEDLVHFEIFEDWKWNTNSKSWKSENKKWINTIDTHPYIPTQETDYDNLYLGGAHTKTSLDIWVMEAAAESGYLVSRLICDKYDEDKPKVIEHKTTWTTLSQIDNILYSYSLPQVIDMIIIIIAIIILLLVYYYIINPNSRSINTTDTSMDTITNVTSPDN